jgi:hypothetical protein
LTRCHDTLHTRHMTQTPTPAGPSNSALFASILANLAELQNRDLDNDPTGEAHDLLMAADEAVGYLVDLDD